MATKISWEHLVLEGIKPWAARNEPIPAKDVLWVIDFISRNDIYLTTWIYLFTKLQMIKKFGIQYMKWTQFSSSTSSADQQ